MAGLGSSQGREQVRMGNPSKMGLWCPCQPTSQVHLAKETVGCGEIIPAAGPAATCPPGLVYTVEENRVNEKPKGRPVPREGEKQHLSCQPGEEGTGAKHWGTQGCTPSFWGDTTCPSGLSAKHPKSQLARWQPRGTWETQDEQLGSHLATEDKSPLD